MSVEITGTEQRAAWRGRVDPPVERVRPGLWSIPVPIPNNPMRYVLVYAFETTDGVVVVDCGWNTEAAWRALVDGLAVAGYAASDVRGALITHIHPDHYGLAGRVREASGAWIALHPDDATMLPGRYGDGVSVLLAHMRSLLVECGVPNDVVDELSEASLGIRDLVSLAEPDILIEHGARMPVAGWSLHAIHTPGHSPGHVCFHERDRRLLLSGDHVLPRISPNISIHVQQAPNPLADFLDALLAVRDLDVEEVLPAHEWRFRPLDKRVDELIAHHHGRLAETERVLVERPGATCWEVTAAMRWSREWTQVTGFMRRAAVGETLAHLVLLERSARVRRGAGSPARWWHSPD